MSSRAPEHIRRAVPEDAPVLSALAARLFYETYVGQNRAEDMQAYIAENFTPAKQAEELADPAFRALLVTIEEELAGYACLRTGPAPVEVPEGIPMEVARFYVDSRWQGEGLAPRLMQACVSEAKDAGCDLMWLGVWKENARAIRFYEKQGFRIAGTLLFRLGGDLQEDHLMVRQVATVL
ncbi:MAG TPA: GNAT family N-acetyltransferase, partial [Thermoanaerobaculia bacterium]